MYATPKNRNRSSTNNTLLRKLKEMDPSYRYNTVLTNMYDRQLGLAEKIIDKMHEDLQYDYKLEIEDFS